MDLKLFKMLCKDSKQHHVMFHELYLVSLLLCIAQNVRFEISYKVLYFETPFLIIFKYYAWVSCVSRREPKNLNAKIQSARKNGILRVCEHVLRRLDNTRSCPVGYSVPREIECHSACGLGVPFYLCSGHYIP